jgi:hypothetical protein
MKILVMKLINPYSQAALIGSVLLLATTPLLAGVLEATYTLDAPEGSFTYGGDYIAFSLASAALNGFAPSYSQTWYEPGSGDYLWFHDGLLTAYSMSDNVDFALYDGGGYLSVGSVISSSAGFNHVNDNMSFALPMNTDAYIGFRVTNDQVPTYDGDGVFVGFTTGYYYGYIHYKADNFNYEGNNEGDLWVYSAAYETSMDTPITVPEPSTLSIALSGAIGLVLAGRRLVRKRSA